MLKLVGITKNAASKSQSDVDIVTSRDLTLPIGYTVQDEGGNNWKTSVVNNLVTGSNTVTLLAANYGAIDALPGKINSPVDIVLGVVSVSNPAAATAGVNEEKESEVRIRRRKSHELSAYSSLASSIARIGDIDGVVDNVGYENDTKEYDAVRDIDAHTTWHVVEGGEIAKIAEILVKNKTAGSPFKGDVAASYDEVITRSDGSTFTIRHTIKLDRQTDIRMYIKMNASLTIANQTIDQPAIKAKIAEKIYKIAEDAVASSLYQLAYSAGDNFRLSDLEISLDDITYFDTFLDAGYDGKFTIDVADIAITEV